MESIKSYKLKFYLYASHYMNYNNKKGEIHPHTWEITCNLVGMDKRFSNFNLLQEEIDTILLPFQDKCLNELEEFRNVNPTTENILFILSKHIQDEIIKNGWVLYLSEISENPTCSYYIDFSKLIDHPTLAQGYCITTYLNASHYTNFENKEVHNHSWEYSVRLVSPINKLVNFSTLKDIINDIMNPLQGKLLNKCDLFKNTMPTIETITNILTSTLIIKTKEVNLYPIWAKTNENSFSSYFVDNSCEYLDIYLSNKKK